MSIKACIQNLYTLTQFHELLTILQYISIVNENKLQKFAFYCQQILNLSKNELKLLSDNPKVSFIGRLLLKFYILSDNLVFGLSYTTMKSSLP